MKKLSFLFVSALALGVTFTSCNKDDDSASSDSTTPASIEGKWSYNKIDYSPAGGVEDYPFNNEGCTKNYLELKANNVTSEGKYIGSECTLETTAGTWEKSGNTITVIGQDEMETEYQLVSVSATELKLKVGNSTTYVFTRS